MPLNRNWLASPTFEIVYCGAGDNDAGRKVMPCTIVGELIVTVALPVPLSVNTAEAPLAGQFTFAVPPRQRPAAFQSVTLPSTIVPTPVPGTLHHVRFSARAAEAHAETVMIGPRQDATNRNFAQAILILQQAFLPIMAVTPRRSTIPKLH